MQLLFLTYKTHPICVPMPKSNRTYSPAIYVLEQICNSSPFLYLKPPLATSSLHRRISYFLRGLLQKNLHIHLSNNFNHRGEYSSEKSYTFPLCYFSKTYKLFPTDKHIFFKKCSDVKDDFFKGQNIKTDITSGYLAVQ